ncbi:MAG: hypothetical protein ABIR64_10190 [Candidatus Limnocylindrales bacterium]
MRTLGLAARLAIVGLVIGATLLSGLSPFGAASLLSLPYAVMGGILIIRRPRTSIGWLLTGVGLCFTMLSVPVTGTPQAYADGSVELPVAAFAVVHAGLGSSAFSLLAILLMVFPSGRLPVGKWGRLARAGLGVALLIAATAFVMPEISTGYPVGTFVRNPIALLPDLAIWQVVNPVTVTIPVLSIVSVGSISLFVRVRRAVGTERQQLLWIAASFALLMTAVVSGFGLSYLVPDTGYGLAWVPAMVALPTVPIAIGIAVLRFRLFEIDRIISRTISYGLVTAVLAAVFLAINLGLQTWVAGVTGGSTVGVALTTLVVAALFQPLRRLTQAPIDRRFNRARVDADRTLAAFGDRVRDEVQLARLSSVVVAAADDAVRPTAAGLWLRVPVR